MTKPEFIGWLNTQRIENKNIQHFEKTYSNSNDYWYHYIPGQDWIQDDINLMYDGIVILLYDKSTNETKRKTFTYEEFIKTNINNLAD